MIGRCRNGKGTLTLALREQYVESECDYPNTTVANDTLEQIRLGNVYGMSYAFEDDWQDTENGVSYERTNETVDGKVVWLRHVKRITELHDVSIVTNPAYEQTSVGVREMGDVIDKAIELQIEIERREADEEAKKKEEEEEAAKREAEAKAEEERELEEQAEQARMMRMQRLQWQRRRMDENFTNSL